MQHIATENLLSTEKIGQEIQYLSPLSKEGCDLYLMPAPNDDNYEKSDKHHLYLYKNDQDEIFYYTAEDDQKKHLESWVFQHQEFNSTKEQPVNENYELVKTVLDITSIRGHTLQTTKNDNKNIQDVLGTLEKFTVLTENHVFATPKDPEAKLEPGKIYLKFENGKIVYRFTDAEGNEEEGEGGAIDTTSTLWMRMKKWWREKFPGINKQRIIKIPEFEEEFDINNTDHLNAIKSEVFETLKQNVILRKYRKNYTKNHGTPFHHRGSHFRKFLKDEYLPDAPKSFLEYFGITLRWVEIPKRLPDMTEDSFSLMRIGNILTFMPEVTSGIIIGSLNFFSAFFEFIKSIHDIIKYARCNDRFRTVRLIEACMRLMLSLIAMPTCILFVLATIFELQSIFHLSLIFPKFLITVFKTFALPYYLIALSIPMLAIFITTMAVNAYIYLTVKNEYEQAFGPDEDLKYKKLKEQCIDLQNDYQNPESVAALPLKLAELNDLKNKKDAFLDAQKDLAFSVIEVLAYILIATGACLALAMFLNPVIAPIATSVALGVTATGVVISTLVKTFQMIDEYFFDNKLTLGIRKFSIEAMDWFKKTVIPAIKDWIFQESSALAIEIFGESTANMTTSMEKSRPKKFNSGNTTPVDHSEEEPDKDSVSCFSFESLCCLFSANKQPIQPVNQPKNGYSPTYKNNSPEEV